MSDTITLIRGDDYSIPLHFTNSDGTDVDLTGRTVFFTAKKKSAINTDDDDDALITKTITSHSNPTGGETVLVLTSAQTDVPAGSYVYDLQLKSPTSKISSSIMGELIVTQDVTKRTS